MFKKNSKAARNLFQVIFLYEIMFDNIRVAVLIKLTAAFQTFPNICQDFLQSYIGIHLYNITLTIAAIYSSSRHNFNIEYF